MSGEKGDVGGKQLPDSVLSEAKGILDEISKIRNQTVEHIKASEESRKQSEAVLATLKESADEVNRTKGLAEESVKFFDASRKRADEGLSALNALLEDSRKYKILAEEHLKATEAARKKADDDATYAFQAKTNTEAHAKAVASYKGQAEGEFATITSNKQKSDELFQAITLRKAACDADGQGINISRKAVEQSAAEILKAAEQGVAKSEEINKSRDSVASAKKEVEVLRDAIIQCRNSVEAAQKEVEQFSTQSEEMTEGVTEAHKQSVKRAGEIEAVLTTAKQEETDLSKVLEHLKRSDLIATGHEERVAKLSSDLESLILKVEGLLPGATSAGLASAFNAQKQRFSIPQRRWLWTFVICICGLVLVALPSFWHAAFGDTVSSWGDIFRSLAMRLPIVIPLVWLAIYAGRNYMLSVRLEEEYAYKEAVSTAFEGYKREMEKITSDVNNPTPLTTLCINILTAIAERPGRIYEGKHEDITVLNEMKTAANKADEIRQKAIASK